MEVIMACENVCRDFHWLPVVAQTIGGLSTLGALIIAWVAYRNWRRPKVADRVSSVASDFLGELKDFEVTLMAARMRPDWPDAFDYEKAKRLLGDATQIRARLQAKAELIGALLSDEALSQAVSDLLFILRTVQQEVQRAEECSILGDTTSEHLHLVLFFGDKKFDRDLYQSMKQMQELQCKELERTINQLRKRCAKLIRMET